MEGFKKTDSSSKSSSSFTSDLFGSKENPNSTSSGFFGSIFPPTNKALGEETLRSGEIDKKQASFHLGFSTGSIEGNSETNETSPYYQEQRVQQPCHLSSSIYYGGQDIYSCPQSTKSGMISRDEVEDDSGSASRGNWWKESLYY